MKKLNLFILIILLISGVVYGADQDWKGTVGQVTPKAGSFSSITDTGLTNTYITKAGTAGLLGDSVIRQDASGNIGVNKAPSSAAVNSLFDISGNVKASGDVSSNSVTTPTLLGSSSLVIRPTTNSTTAIQLQDASGTGIIIVDTMNKRVGIGMTPAVPLDVSGNIRGGRNVTTHSGTENVTTASMMGDAHLVTVAATISLPTAAVGYNITVMTNRATGASAVFSVDVQTGTDVFILNGTALSAGNKITSDGTGYAAVYIECVETGKYIVRGLQGVFMDGGAG